MRLNTAQLKAEYRALCKVRGVPCTKAGLKLHLQKCRAIARVHVKEQNGQRISMADVQRAGMPHGQKVSHAQGT